MKVEDYMKLPKRRLAELLVEKDTIVPFHPVEVNPFIPCYAPDGICTNPQMDCINCPKRTTGGNFITTPNTAIK